MNFFVIFVDLILKIKIIYISGFSRARVGVGIKRRASKASRQPGTLSLAEQGSGQGRPCNQEVRLRSNVQAGQVIDRPGGRRFPP